MSAKGFPGSSRPFSPFRLLSSLLMHGLLPSLLLAAALPASAASYTVTNLNDSGTGSLRAAITAANSDTAGNIVFASGVAGTIVLQSALPNINTTGTMTITGPGASLLTISGQGKYQILGFTAGTVSFSGLTFANGAVSTTNGYQTQFNSDPGWGGAFYITHGTTVTVTACVFTGNSTTNGSGGGAILNEGTLNVVNSLFTGNQSPGFDGGGAIFSLGVMTVSGSSFVSNYAFNEGSAIFNYSDNKTDFGVATVVDTTFVNNVVPTNGGSRGAIYNETGATLTLRHSTFAGNLPATGGSIANGGTMTLTNNVIVEAATGNNECSALPAPATQCPAFPSSPDANGNFDDVAANLKLSALGYHGGLTPTLLPLTGSQLLCGGSTAGAKDVNGNALTADERGFALDPACATGKVDAGAVQAHYLTVTTTADPGTGTCGSSCALRDAITEANTTGAADIVFASGVTGTIKLGSELPVITGTADLVGPGANVLTVSGNSANPVFGVTSGTLDLAGLTIANGKSASNGGAIDNTGGFVTLTSAALSGNVAASNGGAVSNGGTLLVSDSTLSGNSANLGSAIYNTGAVSLNYSTVAGNTASSGGGIYNNSGAVLNLADATLAGNTGGTGPGIDNLGFVSATNSAFDAGSACAGSGCPTSGNGNVVGATNLAALGSYGGATLTVLPAPGSSAICAGSAALLPANVFADQRGFANENLTYTGFSATTPCVDAGAVQTNYTSVQFAGAGPYVATANTPGTTPAIIVSVTENGQNIGGVPVTLTFSGTGSATGLTATTVAGTGATFTSFQATTPAASGDTLSVSLPVVGSDVLAAGAVPLTVNPGVTPPSFTMAVNPGSESANAGGLAIYLVQLQAGKGFNGAVTLSCSGGPAGSVCITFPQTVTFYNGQAWAIAGDFLPWNAAKGAYTVTFTGVAGSTSVSATAGMTVLPSSGWGWWW